MVEKETKTALKFMPRDFIALFMIGCGTVMKMCGYDGIVDMILIGIAGSYFGAELFMNRDRKGETITPL